MAACFPGGPGRGGGLWVAGCAQRPGLRGTDISGPTYPVGPVGRSPGVRRARRLPSRQTSCWGQTDAYTSASLTSGRPKMPRMRRRYGDLHKPPDFRTGAEGPRLTPADRMSGAAGSIGDTWLPGAAQPGRPSTPAGRPSAATEKPADGRHGSGGWVPCVGHLSLSVCSEAKPRDEWNMPVDSGCLLLRAAESPDGAATLPTHMGILAIRWLPPGRPPGPRDLRGSRAA